MRLEACEFDLGGGFLGGALLPGHSWAVSLQREEAREGAAFSPGLRGRRPGLVVPKS